MKKILSILLVSMVSCFGQLQTNKVNNTATIYNTNSPVKMGTALNMGGNKITNMLAGTSALDAVNYAQLTNATFGVGGGNVFTYSNNTFNASLTNKFNGPVILTGTNFINATNFIFNTPLGTIQSDKNGTNLNLNGGLRIFPTDTTSLYGYLFPYNDGISIVGSTNDVDGQLIGYLAFSSLSLTNSGNGEARAAVIRGDLQGGTSGDRGGRFQFSTKDNGNTAASPTLRMTIDNAGRVIGNTNSSSLGLLTNWNATLLSLKMLSNINMGGFGITNLLAGVNPLDAVNLAQLGTATNGLDLLTRNNVWTGSSNTFTGRLVGMDGVFFPGTATNGTLIVTNTVLSLGNITGNGVDNTLPNQTLTGNGSIINQGLGDTRYARLSVGNNFSNGVESTSVTNRFFGFTQLGGTNSTATSANGTMAFVNELGQLSVGSNIFWGTTFLNVKAKSGVAVMAFQNATIGTTYTLTIGGSGAFIWDGTQYQVGEKPNGDSLGYTFKTSTTTGLAASNDVLWVRSGVYKQFQLNGGDGTFQLGTTNANVAGVGIGRQAMKEFGNWSTNVTIDWASHIVGDSEDSVITFAGAASNDRVDVCPPAAIEPGVSLMGIASNGNVIVRSSYYKVVDPASATYKVILRRIQ